MQGALWINVLRARMCSGEGDPGYRPDDWEITPPFEESVRQHYALAMSESAAARGAYGSYHEDVGEERQRVRKEPLDETRRAGAEEEEACREVFAQEHPTTKTSTPTAPPRLVGTPGRSSPRPRLRLPCM